MCLPLSDKVHTLRVWIRAGRRDKEILGHRFAMPRSRTIRTLTALLVAMTVGSLMLIWMETEPIRPPAASLAAVSVPDAAHEAAVFDTDVQLQRLKWRNVVVHSSEGEPGNIAERCHFLVELDSSGRAGVTATALWKRQAEGNHIYVPRHDFEAISVGICIIGDFAVRSPASAQYEALVALVKALQGECGITSDHVYLHSDLVPDSNSPGRAFPVRDFSRRLAES